MAYIPKTVYDYLAEHRTISGAELSRTFGIPGRTARRYVLNFRTGTAEPKENYYETPARSQRYEDWEDEQDEVAFDPIAFLKEAPKLVKQAQAKDPVFTNDNLIFDVSKPVGVIWASCAHLGGRYTAYEEFRSIYEDVLDIPRLYWGSLGDDIEGFLTQFPDVDAVQSQLMSVDNQMILLENILDPLVDSRKLLFGCGSQHGGKWMSRRQGTNRVKNLYLDMGVPFYDGMAYLKISVGEQTYFVGVGHEMPGNSMWNPSHPQARALRWRYPNADVIVMGDKHTPSMHWESVYKDEYEAGNRSSPFVWLLQAGTAKTGPDKFTVQSWATGILGWPITVFYPDQHKVKCTFDLQDAETWLTER
jgi:hypothetical protein